MDNTWVLEIHVPGNAEPYHITIEDEAVIGRGEEVALDLSAYEAIEKGVSRQHVAIINRNDHLIVTDLDTANGSMINEKRMIPNQAYHLANDDVLILGTLKLLVRIIGAPSYENVPRKQTNIERDSGQPAGHGETVLIVEDHVEVAQLFSMMLQRQGYITQISRDATRALRFLEQHKPDAVVLDLMLPGIDGTEICRYIRRDRSLDQTPIVIVSANRREGIEDEVIAAGADVFLSKPVNASELGDVVAAFIERRRGHIGAAPRQQNQTKALNDTETARRLGTVRDDTVAIIVANQVDQPFSISLRRPMTFGRADNGRSVTHIDLSRFNADNYGVSRVHMIMMYKDGKVYVEDAGSMNGTFINEERLKPHHPVQLHSGQEIRIGRLPMRVYFMNQDA